MDKLFTISRELGEITAKVENLSKDMMIMQKENAQHRADLDNKIERILGMIEKQATTINTNTGHILEMVNYTNDYVKPTVEFVHSMRLRGSGFLIAAGIVGTGIGTWLYSHISGIIKFINNL